MTEPAVLFPAIGVILLAAIWAAVIGLINVQHTAAERAAAISSLEILETYEAQVVRALREIDDTLNAVTYWYEKAAERHGLAELQEHGLLPPDLLFVVSIADREGNVVDSTRPLDKRSIADRDYFLQQRNGTSLFVGRLAPGPTGDAKLTFSRRLDSATGEFDGVVLVAVDAAYFVSGYDAAKLGKLGVLALLGADGAFRVRRTDDTLFSGEPVDYAATVPSAPDGLAMQARLSASTWDGVRRWTATREIYGFPLAVLVGLSADEQLSVARHVTRVYVWRALAASLLVALLTVLLGRMGWQLAQSRLREGESKLVHAQRVEYLAYHDGLTALPNRSLFSKLLGQSISEARRYERRLAVAFLDLDRFKNINDTLGHDAGDRLLQEVAARLKECVRSSDTVARLGGDEFVVLLPELHDEPVAIVAQKILAAIARPFMLIGQEFRVTASIGVAIYPQDGLDEQTLTRNADIAMYQAKEEGKNNFQFYSERLNANSLERLTLESSLRHALERNEFRLHYQAKRDIVSGRISGMEALLRWEHPDLGNVPPKQFIPIAEETGLIVPIGKWVMKTACLQNVAWQLAGLPRLSIAVNLSTRQFFDERLLIDVHDILTESGMDPRLLELEITEGLLTRDVASTLRILTGLKALGIRIAIDDFGTGYSSLATLQRYPLDTIKIDRSFIRRMETQDTGLADAIIAMGKSLSLTVVAQGVETSEQAEFLRSHACDELQGFYFKRPLPVEEFTQLLLDQATAVTYIGRPLRLKAG